MSRETLLLVKRSAAMFISGDIDRAVAEFFDPEGEFVSRFSAMEGRSYRGAEGVRRYLKEMDENWASFEREFEEFVDAGDAILAVLRIKAVSKEQRVPLEQRIGLVYWVRDGRVVRLVSYPSVEEARQAVGLSE